MAKKAKESSKEVTLKELNKQISAKKKDLFDFRMKNSLGQLSNPLEIRFLRRDVAGLETLRTLKLKTQSR